MDTRWFLSCDAIDPKNPDGGRWKVGLPEAHYRKIQVSGHDKAIARLKLVLEVLQGGTTHLFEGWSRPGKEDCYVYVGMPKRDHKSLTIDTPAPKGMVFLVFVLADGTLDEWTWRECSKEDQSVPIGINGDLIWSQKPN